MKLDPIDRFPEHEYETDAQGSQKVFVPKADTSGAIMQRPHGDTH